MDSTRPRFRRYTASMRAALGLWWAVVLVGIGTRCVRSGGMPESNHVTIIATNFSFDPKAVTVPAGTTVEWVDAGGRHSIELDDGSFQSGDLVAGGKVSRRFDHVGVYPYHCGFHGLAGGSGMSGTITVTPHPQQ